MDKRPLPEFFDRRRTSKTTEADPPPDLIELDDINPAGYCSLKQIPVGLTTRSGRVSFTVPRNEYTYRVLAEYQSNPLVPALDLISHLKRLRGKMLDARKASYGQGDDRNGNQKAF
jgi:hypothetical protein